MKFLYRNFFLFIFLLTALNNVAYCQVKFSAVASASRVGKNERLQVDFKAENANVENISPPSFNGFIIESGPLSQTGMTIINGSTSRYYSMSYILRPVKKGKLQIGAATAKLDGKVYQSNPLSIEVTENAQGSNVSPYSPFGGMALDLPEPQPSKQFNEYILKKGENIQEKISRNLFVKVDVDKTSCYVGEPIVATYKLYTRLKSESNLTKSPSFNGFSVIDLDVGQNYQLKTETLNGREYSVYVLRRVQVYPLQAGVAEFESCEVDNSISFLKAEYANSLGTTDLQELLLSFAESTMPHEAIETIRASVQSKPVQITVKPLPDQGKPPGFKGAVGEFKMTSWVVKPNMSTDDAGNLRVNITGSGNLHLINAPAIEWPANIEGFDPKTTETLDKTTIPVSGEKQYAYPFTVSKPGKFKIPPIEFSFFDPKTASYKVLNSTALEINVSKGKGNKPFSLTPTANKNSSAADVLMVLIYIALAVAVLLMAAIYFLNRKKGKENNNVVVKEEKRIINEEVLLQEPVIPVSPLIIPQQKLIEGDAQGFFSSLNHSMKEYLSKNLGIGLVDLNHKSINELLDKKGINIHTSQLICSLLDDIELNLYAAPLAAHVQMQEVYEKANEILGLLQKQGFR